MEIVAGKEDPGTPSAVNPRLEGMTVGDIKPDHPLYGKMEGVVIAGVQRGSPAWRSGLREGDVITSVNNAPVKNLQDFLTAVYKREGSLVLRIVRGNAAAFIVIK